MVRGHASRGRVRGFVAVLFVVCAPLVASAQDVNADDASLLVVCQDSARCEIAEPIVETAVIGQPAVPASRLTRWRTQFSAWRKNAGPMVPMYSSYAALQMLDVTSTTRALAHGAVEKNAMLGGIANHAAALTLLKMGTTASTVYAMEHLRKKHRIAAIATMAGLDAMYSVIVVHNYRAVP